MKASTKFIIWALVFLALGTFLHFNPNVMNYLPVKVYVGPQIVGVVKIVFWSLSVMGVLISAVMKRRGQ